MDVPVPGQVHPLAACNNNGPSQRRLSYFADSGNTAKASCLECIFYISYTTLGDGEKEFEILASKKSPLE